MEDDLELVKRFIEDSTEALFGAYHAERYGLIHYWIDEYPERISDDALYFLALETEDMGLLNHITVHIGIGHQLLTDLSIRNQEGFKFLVDRGADFHDFYEDILRSAIERGDQNLVRYLIRQGADIEAHSDDIEDLDEWILTPIEVALSSGHIEIACLLYQSGARIDYLTPQWRERVLSRCKLAPGIN